MAQMIPAGNQGSDSHVIVEKQNDLSFSFVQADIPGQTGVGFAIGQKLLRLVGKRGSAQEHAAKRRALDPP